jgi:hypothetical protein
MKYSLRQWWFATWVLLLLLITLFFVYPLS